MTDNIDPAVAATSSGDPNDNHNNKERKRKRIKTELEPNDDKIGEPEAKRRKNESSKRCLDKIHEKEEEFDLNLQARGCTTNGRGPTRNRLYDAAMAHMEQQDAGHAQAIKDKDAIIQQLRQASKDKDAWYELVYAPHMRRQAYARLADAKALKDKAAIIEQQTQAINDRDEGTIVGQLTQDVKDKDRHLELAEAQIRRIESARAQDLKGMDAIEAMIDRGRQHQITPWLVRHDIHQLVRAQEARHATIDGHEEARQRQSRTQLWQQQQQQELAGQMPYQEPVIDPALLVLNHSNNIE